MENRELSRYHLLAAEIFGYSYANYRDHLGIGNLRFEELMPQDAKRLEAAVSEDWPIGRVAQELEVDTDNAAALVNATRDAIQVVDADNPSESFRNVVRQVIQRAVAEGLNDDEAIEELVTQMCYRVSDLAYLLKAEGSDLSRYCRHLRREPDVEYFDGYFDEED